jgi:hypothetical protein
VPSRPWKKFSCRATPQEIADNDFNLNIPGYADTFEEEAETDLDTVKADITRLESELAALRAKMPAHLEELVVWKQACCRNSIFQLLISVTCAFYQRFKRRIFTFP